MTKSQEIGNRIRTLRKRMGITQMELAARTDLNNEMISRYERGKYLPSVIGMVRIAEELYTTVEYLVTGEEDP